MVRDPNQGGGEPGFLLVRSGGYRCAIPVESAKLVTRAPSLAALPGSEPRLLGLAQIAGEPLAVVDLHALVDPSGNPVGGHELTVIVRRRDGGATLGLAVSEALGVVDVGTPDQAGPDDPAWVVGRCRIDDRDVLVLDPDRLLVEPGSKQKGPVDAA
jgi:chemotaxis signal transduction protein